MIDYIAEKVEFPIKPSDYLSIGLIPPVVLILQLKIELNKKTKLDEILFSILIISISILILHFYIKVMKIK